MEIDEHTKGIIGEFFKKIMPESVKEFSALLADPIRHWRANNQLQLFMKTREKCIKYNVPTSIIAPRLVYSLLDLGSLEDDEYMQGRWVNLFINMLDSEQNIQNHVFPYLLSQLSKNEYEVLKSHHYDKVLKRGKEIPREIEKIEQEIIIDVENSKKKLAEESEKLTEGEKINYGFGVTENWHTLYAAKQTLQREFEDLELFAHRGLKGYEYDNLERLGIIINIPIANIETHYDEDAGQEYVTNVVNDDSYYQTSDLGVLLLTACEEIRDTRTKD